jgi:hypothetical protein
MNVKAVLLTALLVLGPAALCAAQPPPAEAPTVTGETGLFTLPTGETLPRGTWSFGLYFNNWDRLFDPDDSFFGETDDIEVEWSRASANLGYGITDRWEVTVTVPFYDDYDFHHDEQFLDETLDVSGPNNIRVGTNYQFFRNEAMNAAASIIGFVEPPTSDSDVAADDTGFGFMLGAHVRELVFSFGYRQPGDEEDLDVPEELIGGFGYVRAVNDRFQWVNELSTTLLTGGDDTLVPGRNSLDLTSGGRYWFPVNGSWALNFGARFNLIGLSGVGAVVGLTYGTR